MAHRTWFWNVVAKRYFRQAIADPAAYKTKLDMTQAHLRPDMRLFEFGCGTGSTALVHAPLVQHVSAIDISPKMIDIARMQAAQKGIANADFHVSAIQEWPSPEQPYDMVLGMSIFHLLTDRQAVLRKIYDELADDGLFVSSTSCIADMGGLAPRLLPAATRLGLLPILRVFSAEQLVQEMQGAGFEVVETFHPAPDKAIFLICRKVALS